MAKENEYTIAGFYFTDIQEFNEAKKEAETIEYIKANTDINDMNKVLKLYHRLIEKKAFSTIVGYSFLKELRDRILKEGIVSDDKLPSILIGKEKKNFMGKTILTSIEQNREQKYKTLVAEYKTRHRNSRIINIGLTIIIIAMIFIAVQSDRTLFSNYKEELIDYYASWQEELEKREKAITEREEQLESKTE